MGHHGRNFLNDVSLPGRSSSHTFSSSFLNLVHIRVHPFDISVLCDGDDGLLIRNQILLLEFLDSSLDDFGFPFVAIFILKLRQLILDKSKDFFRKLEQVFKIGNELELLFELIFNLLPFQAGQRLKPHFQNGCRLAIGKLEFLHQIRMRFVPGRRLLNRLDDSIDIIQRFFESFQDMRPVESLFQFEFRPSGNNFLPMDDKVFQNRLEIQDLRIDPIHQSQHVYIEVLLQIRHRIQLVEDFLRISVFLKLDNYPYSVLAGFIPKILDSNNLPLSYQVRDLSDQIGLIGSIGYFRNDNLEHSRFRLHDFGLCPCRNFSLSGIISFLNIRSVIDDSPGRKVRTLDEFKQIINRGLGIFNEVRDGIYQFIEIVWRNVRRHSHRDTHGSIEEQLRKFRRQHDRLGMHTIEVRYEINRILFDIHQHLFSDGSQLSFSVSISGRAVSVHGTEVSLSPDQRITQSEVLRHADHRVINGRVTVRMIFTEHLSDYRSRLSELGRSPKSGFPHGIQNSPVHRLETVPHVRKGPGNDDAHRIIQI